MSIKTLGNNSSRRRRSEIISDINVTPFIDVMLVLLVIFMITSPIVVAGIHVDLPSANATPIAGSDEPLSVTINTNGAVYIHDTEIDTRDLEAKLRAVTQEKLDTRIFVRGDKTVDYGKIMEVVGIINEAGFQKVSLVTEVNGPSKR